MKVAITGTGNSLDSTLDQRFGRCSYFFIYDTDNGGLEIIPNHNKDGREGVGPASVELVASRRVEKIISGEFGMKIKSLLDSLNIQMIILKKPEKTIQEVIDMIDQNSQHIS